MKETDTCVFCSYQGPVEDFPPEHWIPNWLNRELFPRYAKGGVLHNTSAGETWTSDEFDLTVPHVCWKCNRHWMSDIESRVKPLVWPLIAENTTMLPTEHKDQLLLATWCFMKALTLELGRPDQQEPTFPPELYRGFGRHRTPPMGCSIGLAARETIVERSPMYLWFESHAIKFDTALPPTIALPGYHTTLAVGHLVIDVAGVFISENVEVDHGEHFVRLFPRLPGLDVNWPPERLFQVTPNRHRRSADADHS